MDNENAILDYLVKNKKIFPVQAENILKAAQVANKELDDYLADRKIASYEDIAKIKAQISSLPYENIVDKVIDREAMEVISREVAENYHITCFYRDSEKIKVGITNPNNFKATEAIVFLAKEKGLHVEFYVISKDSLRSAMKRTQTIADELKSVLKERGDDVAISEKKVEKEDGKLDEITKSAPVIKIVSVIIRNAVEGRASDIHVEPIGKETRIRYRIDGILRTSLILPRNIHQSIVARIKVMAGLKLDETRIPQDGRIRLMFGEKEVDFRVSILPLVDIEKVVLRILDTNKGAPKLTDLGFWGRQLKVVEANSKRTEGLLVVTGPTGSGKSTTLFSVLDIVNNEGINISTLEDPVEYQMKGVNQSQIKPEIGYTFAAGLRSFLRQDPDVIMVGEIRDKETAELSIHAALTGHMVFSTVHTTSAIGAIARMIDMEIEPFLIGSTMHTIIGQRLTRRICQSCKEEDKVPPEYIKMIQEEVLEISVDIKEVVPDFDINNIKVFRGHGCSHCGNTGFVGRLAIVEVIDLSKELKQKMMEERRSVTMDEIKADQHFLSMRQDGIIKVLQGLTTIDEVQRVMKV